MSPVNAVIKSCQLISGGRTARWTYDEREYEQVWRVLTTGATIGPIDALLGTQFSLGASTYLSFLEYDNYAYLTELDAKEVSGDRTQWIVTARYSTRVDPGKRIESVFDREPEISWSFGKYEQEMTKDRDGKPIQNTAEYPFYPPFMRSYRTVVLNYARNEALFDVATVADMIDSVNSSPFLGAEAETVRFADARAQQAFERGVPYYRVSYVFEWKRSKWDVELLNTGMYEKGGKEIRIGGNRVSHPVKLKPDGKAYDPQGTNAHYVTFKVNDLRDFNTLNIV